MSHPRALILTVGESLSAKEWAERQGLSRRTIFGRLSRGWTPEQALGIAMRPATKPGRKTQHSLTPDYLRRYSASRRAIAVANGICIECNSDPAEEGKSKCPTCLAINANAQRERRAA